MSIKFRKFSKGGGSVVRLGLKPIYLTLITQFSHYCALSLSLYQPITRINPLNHRMSRRQCVWIFRAIIGNKSNKFS